MHKRKSLLVGILLAAMLVTVGVSGCTPDELTALEGIFQNMDSVSGTITVQLTDGSTQTFNFSDVKAETIRQALGDLSIEAGDTVILQVDGNGDVQEIEGNNNDVDDGDVDNEDIDDGDVDDEDVDEEEEELKVEGLVTAYNEGVNIEVDGQPFIINGDTDIEGTPVAGTSIVEVEYVVQDDGSFLAVEIEAEDDED